MSGRPRRVVRTSLVADCVSLRLPLVRRWSRWRTCARPSAMWSPANRPRWAGRGQERLLKKVPIVATRCQKPTQAWRSNRRF